VSIMFPIVALVLSTIFEGYRLNLLSGFGISSVLAGNALILLQKQRAKSGTATESSVDGSALRTKGQTA